MKLLRLLSVTLGLDACAAVAICLLTDWNDDLFLPLGLCMSVAANALNVLAVRQDKVGKENVK